VHAIRRCPLPGALLPVLFSMLLTVAGCTPNAAFRQSEEIPSVACVQTDNEPFPESCRRAFTETTPDYDLHFVEFDDQGWRYPDAAEIHLDPRQDQSSKQLDTVMDRLRKAADEGRVRLYVFVHGWKHNAAYNDTNVVNFRNFLREAAAYEHVAGSRARVIGLYVGWRGKSWDVGEPLASTTFWERKAAALHVAIGSMRELTAELRALQRRANRADAQARAKDIEIPDQKVRIYMIGHSFGGLVLFNAVSQSLVNSFVEGEDIDSRNSPIDRLGDMIVLINPAFEATRFEPLDRVARKRDYFHYQSPVFVSITSDADKATGKLFPLGRTINTIFESELTNAERSANRNTIGHIPAYITHRLTLDPARNRCSDWVVNPNGDAQMASNVLQEVQNSVEFKSSLVDGRWPSGTDGRPAERVFCGGLVLEPLGRDTPTTRNADPNMPLWNITLTGDIVPDHNDINEEIFRAFLRQLFLDESFNRRFIAVQPAPQR
jgi:hypothetical protein